MLRMIVCCSWLLGAGVAFGAGSPRVIPVAPAWSGHPVGFSSLTVSNRQFVAFYNAERQMMVAARPLKATNWTFATLPEKIGWDSHNYITMAVDGAGFLHLSGNMHGNPLVYFRSARPLDIASFERLAMTGQLEQRTTYPRFFNGPNGELIFTYRTGGSGNGDQVYNVYDTGDRKWRRLIDQPLISGEEQKSAYLHGPMPGPDGWFHLVWIWRETPDCATSHYVCYARTRDLVNWETSRGKALALPITFATCEVVDPVPINGGAINGNVVLGFDLEKRPVISYHKFDKAGHTQVYNTRLEDGRWVPQQATAWTHRWEFGGGGSIEFEVRVGAVTIEDGALTQNVSSRQPGTSGTWRLDPSTLKAMSRVTVKNPWPAELRKPRSSFPDMHVKMARDEGDPAVSRWLRWETLGPNRDRPRTGALPEPVMLEVYEFGGENGS